VEWEMSLVGAGFLKGGWNIFVRKGGVGNEADESNQSGCLRIGYRATLPKGGEECSGLFQG